MKNDFSRQYSELTITSTNRFVVDFKTNMCLCEGFYFDLYYLHQLQLCVTICGGNPPNLKKKIKILTNFFHLASF